jgi:hypothetical protein
MYSWLAWTVFAAVAILLGVVGYLFSVRSLRWVTLVVALLTAAYVAVYGLTHTAQKPGSLVGAFSMGANALSSALLWHRVPAPGRVGWLVIGVLLVFGYRGLEAWTLHRQAPSLDVSALTSDQQDDSVDGGTAAETTSQQHARLVAELKFWLPAVQVRSPSILPGGSRPAGLASIAEASGAPGGGLAGAIIRFFGMIWPNPPLIQVRAWVDQTAVLAAADGVTRVTVSLGDPRSGASIATKTVAAGTLDEASAAVAGYVARHIFARDRTVPPWSISATDGTDLAALLLARQVRGYPEHRDDIRYAWDRQIKILESVARSSQCAGVVRYELAQLYDLTGKHAEALLLHAANREQYPRFYRGRYRLAMSLEMLANPASQLTNIDMTALKKAVQILDRCCVTTGIGGAVPDAGQAELPDRLRLPLLAAARQELRETQKYLTWRHIVAASLWRRNERTILSAYRRPRHRQAFHDGVCVASLLVAVRQELAGVKSTHKLRHARTIARIAAAISGNSTYFNEKLRHFPARRPRRKLPVTSQLRARRVPWQYSTPSWTAAYNLACAYAALAADRGADPHPVTGPESLVQKVVRSLEFAVFNPECEMERPSEWIGNDPDFNALHHGNDRVFTTFLYEQHLRDYWPDPNRPPSRVGCPAQSPYDTGDDAGMEPDGASTGAWDGTVSG